MKVLYVWHSLVEPEYQKILHALKNAGVDVLGILPSEWTEGGRDLSAGSLPSDLFRVFPIIGKNRINRFFFPNILGVLKTIREFGPDIVHLAEEPSSLVNLEFLTLLKLAFPRTMVVVQSSENIQSGRKLHSQAIERIVLSGVDCLVTVPHEGIDLWKRKGFTKPICQIPHGIDLQTFSPLMGKNAQEQSASQSLKVGYVGRLVEEKGIYDLLEACSSLAKEGYSLSLSYRGNGPEQENLKRRIRIDTSSLAVQVSAAIPVSELREFYRSLDILVLPSRTTPTWKEQFGRVIIEAMACGIPVIGSSSGEIPNVIGNGGMVFEEGNILALKECLKQLLRSPDLRNDLSQKARKVTEQYFSWDKIALDLKTLYESLLNEMPVNKGEYSH